MPRPPQNTPTAPFPGHITLDMILKSPPKLVHHPNTPPTLNRPTSDLTCPLYYLSCVFLNPFAQPLCIVPYARHCSYSAICGPSPPSPLPLYRKKVVIPLLLYFWMNKGWGAVSSAVSLWRPGKHVAMNQICHIPDQQAGRLLSRLLHRYNRWWALTRFRCSSPHSLSHHISE